MLKDRAGRMSFGLRNRWTTAQRATAMRGKGQQRDGAYDCCRQATAPVPRGSSGVYRAGMSPLSESSEKRRTWDALRAASIPYVVHLP